MKKHSWQLLAHNYLSGGELFCQSGGPRVEFPTVRDEFFASYRSESRRAAGLTPAPPQNLGLVPNYGSGNRERTAGPVADNFGDKPRAATGGFASRKQIARNGADGSTVENSGDKR